jgi:DNA-binding NarL/FixJ family response regulator
MRTAVSDALRAAGIEVGGMAESGAELLGLLEQGSPDAIVLDLRLGGSNGIELARTAAELAPDAAIVLHTTFADSRTVADALAAGVRAVVLKRASPSMLLYALEEVVAGRTFIDPRLR